MKETTFIPGYGDDSLGDDAGHESPLYAIATQITSQTLNQDRYLFERLLLLYPALISQIINSYLYQTKKINKNIRFKDLPDNSSIISQEKIELKKIRLIETAKQLHEITGSSLIKFVRDDCITNKKLSQLLQKIFGNLYHDFVDEVDIDYNKTPDSQSFEQHIQGDNYILLLGGSESDTYKMNDSHFHSGLSRIIRETGADYSKNKSNIRVIGVCFGHQYICKLLSEQNTESGSIGVTNQYIYHLGLSDVNLTVDKFTPDIYKNILEGVSNGGKNRQVSVQYTRGSAFHNNLLKTGEKGVFISLGNESLTNLSVINGVNNGKVFTFQPHFEISMIQRQDDILEWAENITPIVAKNTGSTIYTEKILENFGYTQSGSKYVKRDVDEALYVFAINAYLEDILKQLKKRESLPPSGEEYNIALQSLRDFTRWRVDGLLPQPKVFNPEISIQDFLKQVDISGRLRLNRHLDWKVDRGILEGSKILGIKNLAEFIKYLRMYHNTKKNNAFLVLDNGAGDGTMISELYRELSGYDVIEYGLGDFLYLDLYHMLKNHPKLSIIPNKLKIIFVNKILQNLSSIPEFSHTVQQQLQMATQNLSFSEFDKLSHGSMFSEETHMFPGEELIFLGKEGMEYVSLHQNEIEILKDYCQNHFYELGNKLSDRIYVSSFSDLKNLPNNIFRYPDFQYSIRATSHIDGPEYMSYIDEAIHERMPEGGVLLDNGVHRSYTSIPRIPELYTVYKASKVPVRMRLLFDTKTNYFTSVLIERTPFVRNIDIIDLNIIEANLADGIILIDIEEAYRATFFRIEHFLRNMIIANFKFKNVFWNFNREIVSTIEEIISHLYSEERDIHFIKTVIIRLFNKIAVANSTEKEIFGSINENIFSQYLCNGITINEILQDFYHPDWINPNGKRYY